MGMEMTSTAAASTAGVTVATIRTWCRRNVIAAAKRAGRWVIDAASLAYRITLARKKGADMIDLTTTYTWTEADGYENTVTPKVSDRVRPTGRIVSVSGLAPLLASELDAIPEADRGHTLTVLTGAVIALREEPAGFAGGVQISSRLDGRVSTTYTGTPDLPVETVLDLGERLHAQLI